MVTLEDLKVKRATEKRKVTSVYNSILAQVTEGYEEELENQLRKLASEYSGFIAAHNAYAAGLESKGASVAGHAQHNDYLGLETYFAEMDKKVRNARYQVTFVKVREEFEDDWDAYRRGRNRLIKLLQPVKDRSDAELLEFDGAKVLLDSANPQLVKFEKNYHDLYGSLKDFKKASRAASKNSDDILASLGYDAGEDDLHDLETTANKLASAVMKIENKEKEVKCEVAKSTPAAVKLEKIEAFKFSGEYRDWASFKRKFTNIVIPNRDPQDIGLRLLQAIPLKHQHLIDNLDPGEHVRMMAELEKKFGKHCHIVTSCSEEIEGMSKPTTDEQFITMVERLEKIKSDLEAIGYASSLDHVDTIRKVEARLPDVVKSDWLKFMKDNKLLESNSFNDRFSVLLQFLIEYKGMADYETGGSIAGAESKSKFCVVTGVTVSPSAASSSHKASIEQKDFRWEPCLACHREGAVVTEEMHHKTGKCANWRKLSLENKIKLVQCIKHPFSPGHKTEECQGDIRPCYFCGSRQHHSLLCDRKKPDKSTCMSVALDVCDSGSTVRASCAKSLVKTHIVQGRTEDEHLDLMEDGGSTDSFVKIMKAENMDLPSEPVVLSLEGINGTKRVESRIYEVPIRDKMGVLHYITCYGLDEIASDCEVPAASEYKELCDKFNVSPEDVRRPKQVDVLISAKHNFLMSDTVKASIDGVKLYEGPLGLTFMGDYGGGNQMVRGYPVTATPVSVKRAVTIPLSNKEILDFFKDSSIEATCNSCPPGPKQMTIEDEKKYKQLRKNMFLDKEGTEEDPGPYWRTSYPWVVPREDLVNNLPAVLGVMHSTARKLDKDPAWRQTYEQQLRDLINRGFAKEINQQEIDNWVKGGGQVYYIAHQMVLDETNKTSPIRCVFNSSQKYRGHSLNGSWALGPDMTGNLQAILHRFREGLLAAQGDIKKMYYAIRVQEEERMMQLWVWHFSGEEQIRVFSMTRLVMGNKPSANLSQIALRETAHLEDNATEFPAAQTALCQDSYVDNTFLQGKDQDEIKDKIREVEHVAALAGFSYKPWIISYQEVEDVSVAPGARLTSDNTEKALGLYWRVKEDQLMVKVQINGKKRRINLSLSQLIDNPSLKLTVRDCLSLHARCFDPTGLVNPVKMTGAILFRNTLQHISAKIKVRSGSKKLPWDEGVEGELRDKWMEYFRMLEAVSEIKFPRSMQPANADMSVKPSIVTLSDGGRDAYGAVAYYLWTLEDGSKEARLVTSKSKLGPLLEKGEPVKNELSGAVFAVRIRSWIIENSTLTFDNFFPFIDSQIVWWMMRKESYELNTFYGNRVKELGQNSDVTTWNHIAREYNGVADILTRGATPDMIREDSEWQMGPKWLTRDMDTWPVTQVLLSREQREEVREYERASKAFKAVSHCESSTHGPQCQVTYPGSCPRGAPDHGNDEETEDYGVEAIIHRCSSLKKIVRIVAHFLRLGGRDQNKLKAISASEFDDALKVLIKHEQKHVNVKKFSGFDVSTRQFTLNSGAVIELMILQTRVKNFPIQFGNHEDFVFVLPARTLAKRIASHFHNKFHRDVDTVVTQIRKEFWIPGVRRLVTVLDRNCRRCLILRQKVAGQLMGTLPEFRSQPCSAFSHSTLDLFGPVWIRDSVVKRGPRVRKKAWGVLITCGATRAVYIDISEDYSTESVLHVIRRFQAEKGKIDSITSDPGTQLQGANNELKMVRQGWSEEELVRFGAENGIEWRFTMAAAPHQNGVTEILVRMVKGVMGSMMEAIGTTVLSLNELFTVCKEVQSLCNERPIGLKPNSQTDPAFLSPNSLLLGRCSDRINSGPFQRKENHDKDPDSDRTRYLLVQSITDQFWKVWTKLYFPTLLRRPKWHHEQRNMRVGDVCLLQDSNTVRGEWRMCKVKEVMPDSDGKVRNVVVTVPPPSLRLMKGTKYPTKLSMNDLDRHVSSLIVIAPVELEQMKPFGGECEPV